MRKKGFTLVELLVVIAIIAMLLAILMPALNKVRQIAYRMTCGSNLSGLGKACITYANDYQDAYPVTTGASTIAWDYQDSVTTFWETNTTNNPTWNPSTLTKATVYSSMYLLIKYADVSTGQFVCRATSSKKFDLSTASGLQNSVDSSSGITDVTQAWDFGKVVGAGGNGPWDYCSYAYQMPYNPTKGNTVRNALTSSMQAGTAVMADASPWWKQGKAVSPVPPTATSVGTGPYMPTAQEWGITGSAVKDRIRLANSTSHQQDGQNVLYGDAHVTFESQSNVGITQDNIYVPWHAQTSGASSNQNEVQGYQGDEPLDFTCGSFDPTDSFLVN